MRENFRLRQQLQPLRLKTSSFSAAAAKSSRDKQLLTESITSGRSSVFVGGRISSENYDIVNVWGAEVGGEGEDGAKG